MSGVASKLHHERARAAGFGTNAQAVKFLNQDYEALKRECLRSGQLFQDNMFEANISALGFNKLGPNSPDVQGVEWLRPKQLSSNPMFISGGATKTDICQGILGDCWLLAAIASLTLNQDVFARVVPSGQDFDSNYAGIFHFQFWQFGEWVDVVIDDRLPTIKKRLLFVHSAERSEFWSALMEKAYAKVNGCYEALSGGRAMEAFEDFTGGIAEEYVIAKASPNLFKTIQKALSWGSLLSCAINATSPAELEAITNLKLVKGHAYSVTEAVEVEFRGTSTKLIQIRNPWGHKEWNGPWSDGSSEWNQVRDSDRQKLLTKAEDGEFWMSFSDFQRYFSRVEICNLTPDSLSDDSVNKWALSKFDGSWRRGSTAGGCRNYPDSFWMNPQFVIKLDEADDDPTDNVVGCSFVLGLIQKNRRKMKQIGEGLNSIGFSIYKVPQEVWNADTAQNPYNFYCSLKCLQIFKCYFQDKVIFLFISIFASLEEGLNFVTFVGKRNVHLDRNFFMRHGFAARTEHFSSMREVCSRFCLPPGEYIIVPSTFEPDKDGDFCVRVFSEKQAEFKELDDPINCKVPEINAKAGAPDSRFKSLFEQLAGSDNEISAFELQDILNKVISARKDIKTDGFSLDTCRNMVNLLDKDGSGKLGLDEFKILWTKIEMCLDLYCKNDKDKSGTMSSGEMREAVGKLGFSLNNALLQILVARYGDFNLTIDFDNFVSCVIRLECMFKTFMLLDKDRNGKIELNLFEWLNLSMI